MAMIGLLLAGVHGVSGGAHCGPVLEPDFVVSGEPSAAAECHRWTWTVTTRTRRLKIRFDSGYCRGIRHGRSLFLRTGRVGRGTYSQGTMCEPGGQRGESTPQRHTADLQHAGAVKRGCAIPRAGLPMLGAQHVRD